MLRRALLLLLLPLILGACGVAGRPGASPSAAPVPPIVDAPLLQQWSAWSTTPRGGAHCSFDKQSDLWFVAAPSGQASANWGCNVPAGASLLVVAASMSGVTLPMCSRDYTEQVGVDGSASLDGQPVALRWLGPVDADASPGPRTLPERTCALTGITVPLTEGYHTLITQYILRGTMGTVTMDVNAT
ncbi:hypothetical protein [Actinoplanes sp. NPDC051411]|uniref:hypothetical protein n=1 Tax=Actinoplanes sp. NPDC051411 TaxID=3155522 RepID=UPI0034461077